LANVWKQNSVVHCQPARSGQNALRYLSAYIFKTATANRVVTLLPNGKVRWPYRDSNTRWPAAIDLEPDQLISRFLQHVLPPHFCRVRLFGWLHPGAKVRANRVRALLGEKALLTPEELRTWQPPPDQKGELALAGREHPARIHAPLSSLRSTHEARSELESRLNACNPLAQGSSLKFIPRAAASFNPGMQIRRSEAEDPSLEFGTPVARFTPP
jgi:hypothetical protein